MLGSRYWLFVFSTLLNLVLVEKCNGQVRSLSSQEKLQYKDKIKSMFYHAYDSYLEHADGFDELMPISCSGMNTWGTFSLSLIDALDTLAIMGNYTEFRRVTQHIVETASFETNTNVSVFETNIRVIGGLLSAHLLSVKAGLQVEEGWPCSGPLLRLAENVARKLLPAFDTATGMPYGTVNFLYGVPENETPVTCTAGVGTFIVEFGALSRLTGDPIFEQKALAALEGLQKYRSKIGLLGNHVNVQDGKWVATEAGIGAGVDSYFEYLVKGALLLQMPNLMEVFHYDYDLIKSYIKKNDWFVWVSMTSGAATMPIFQSLEAFFPGLLTLIGDLDQAKKSLYNYHQVWKQYGFVPEFYDIVNGKLHKRDGYPLRPEFIESVLYLYQATKDPHLLNIGADVVDSIYHSARTDCGYATIKSVHDHTVEDRMESFFLAETLKYLYLLFDEENFIHNKGSSGTIWRHRQDDSSEIQTCVISTGGYVFNTEAHPIDIAALSCCSKEEVSVLPLHFNLFESSPLKKMSHYDVEELLKEPLDSNMDEQETERHSTVPETEIKTTASSVAASYDSVTQHHDIPGGTDQIDTCSNENCDIPSLSSTQLHPSFTEVLPEETTSYRPSSEKTTQLKDAILQADDDQTNTQHSSLSHTLVDDFTVPISSINEATPSIDASSTKSVDDALFSQTFSLNNATFDLTDYYRELKLLTQFDDDELDLDTSSKTDNYELMFCPSQSFLTRLSLHGQMFD